MRQKLHGRVVIVTGGGRGLGRAMTLGLARAGAVVVATAANNVTEVEDVAKTARNELGEARVIPIMADVTSAADCERVVALTLQQHRKVDVVINNAARGLREISESYMTSPARFWEIAPDTWRRLIDTNINGPFHMARAAVPHMIANKWGRIINVSATYNSMRRAGFSPYGPSKAALESATTIWASELNGTGVTVNILLPGGGAKTQMVPDAIPADVTAKLLDPEIMIAPARWLSSNDSDGITGKRVNAARWPQDIDDASAAALAREDMRWPP